MAKKKTAGSGGIEALKQASQGLRFQSETDAPFEVFEWPGETGKPAKDRVLELAGKPANAVVKTKTVDRFFKNSTAEQDWQDETEKAEVEKFKQLVKTIKETLQDVQIFQIGETEADVYIVGRTETGWAGLKTKVVET